MITERPPNPDFSVQEALGSALRVDGAFAGLVPLVVGVTGHRDIPQGDRADVLERVNRVLDDFERRWPHSPKVLASGLAEGADQWVCECALNRSWHVVAGLAAPVETFVKDFSSEEVRAQFEALRARCLSVQVLAGPDCPSPVRYERVGLWICRQSQWLIGLWDGEPASDNQPGGTAWVIQHFLRGEVGSDLQFPDCGPVTQIQVRRSGTDRVQPRPVGQGTLTLWPHAIALQQPSSDTDEVRAGRSAQDHWQSILTRIDEFNRLACTQAQRHPHSLLQPIARLGPAVSREAAPGQSNPVLARSVALHAVADQLALRAQDAERWRLGTILVFAVLASILAELYSGPLQSAQWLALGLIALFAALGLTWWPRLPGRQHSLLRDAEARYQDCRGLAEACRVQAFWAYAGLNDSVADHYLPDQRDELEWLRQALRNLHLIKQADSAGNGNRSAAPESSPETNLDRLRIESIRSDWIVDQRRWHKKSASSQARMARRLNACVVLSLIVSLLAVVGALVLETSIDSAAGLTWLQWEAGPAWLQFVWGTALSLAAAAGSIRVIMGYRENVRNYTRLRLTEALAIRELDRLLAREPFDLKACQQVIRALGRAALDENGEWLLLHRDRPAGPPI